MGDLRIENVPVHTIPDTIRLSAPDGRVTRGAIGTSVLSRFLSTIDYPAEKLVLRRNSRSTACPCGTWATTSCCPTAP